MTSVILIISLAANAYLLYAKYKDSKLVAMLKETIENLTEKQ